MPFHRMTGEGLNRRSRAIELPGVKRLFQSRRTFCGWAVLVATAVWAAVGVAAVDASGPAGALKRLYEGMEANDAARVRACFYTADDQEKGLADAYAAQLTAARTLGEALKQKYGATGDALSKGIPLRDQIDALDKAKIDVNGDKATVTLTDQSKPLHLVKVDGSWRVAIADYAGATPANIAVQTNVLSEMAEIFNSVAADINADKFPGPAEAQRALQQKLQAVLFRTLQKHPPTTQATSKPSAK
jgi:hypothetical protein